MKTVCLGLQCRQLASCFWVVWCPCNTKCIAWTDLLRQLHLLPHWDTSWGWDSLSHQVTMYWDQVDQCWWWPCSTSLAGPPQGDQFSQGSLHWGLWGGHRSWQWRQVLYCWVMEGVLWRAVSAMDTRLTVRLVKTAAPGWVKSVVHCVQVNWSSQLCVVFKSIGQVSWYAVFKWIGQVSYALCSSRLVKSIVRCAQVNWSSQLCVVFKSIGQVSCTLCSSELVKSVMRCVQVDWSSQLYAVLKWIGQVRCALCSSRLVKSVVRCVQVTWSSQLCVVFKWTGQVSYALCSNWLVKSIVHCVQVDGSINCTLCSSGLVKSVMRCIQIDWSSQLCIVFKLIGQVSCAVLFQGRWSFLL